MDCTLLLLLLLVSQSGLLASAGVYNLEDPYPPEDSDSRVPLYFSLIQSFSGQYISSYSLPGLQLALDLINEDETLLPGYSLHFVITDTECNKIAALDSFHRQIFEGPTKIGIIGSGCSVSTEPTASISHYYNLVQISCIASSPAFRDRKLFPRYFQLLPTDASLAITYMGLIEFYQWKRVAIIVQMENLFTVAMDELKVLLKGNSIEYSETELVIDEEGVDGGPPNSTIVNLDSVFDESSRIFIISTYEPLAREIICEAYRKGYRYPQYLFFMIPWYVNGWWRFEEDSYGCTVAEREETLEYSMTVMNLPFAIYLNMSTNTDTGHEGTDNGRGMTVGEYFEKVKEYLKRPPLNVTLYDDVAPVCYDAMWTLALALNNTITEFETNISLSNLAYEAGNMPNRNEPFRMENFTYQNDVVMETMFKHLEETDFLGVSGDVTFNEVGIRRVTQYLILQFRKNSSNLIVNEAIGVWSTNSSLVYTANNTEDTTWPFGIPYDGVSVDIVINTVHKSITSIMIIFSTVGILFSIACLVFNFYFRNQTLIRLSSPNLNYLIGSGAILLYLSIIVTVLPADTAVFSSIVCNLRVWLTGFGYSLCYGTILVKMWRVYYIFSNPSTLKKANLHDWMLAIMVLCFVIIDLVMLVIFSLVEGLQGNLTAERVLDKEASSTTTGEQGRIKEFYVYVCNTMAWDIFLGIFYGYKAFLQVCGLFLAFATRKVKVKGLDDAKWIAGTIYITSIVLAITILALYTLSDFVNRHTAVFTGGLFIGTTFIMAFVFVSKMYALYKDPEGKSVFDRTKPTDRPQASNPDSVEQSGRLKGDSYRMEEKEKN